VAIFYEDVLRALDAASVRYVLVGGVAVILHGVPRTTADLDLVLDLAEDNMRRFVEVMTRLGFVPRAPVAAEDLASGERRREWLAEKHMVAFTFHRPGRPLDEVDVIMDPPLPFAEMAAGAEVVEAEGMRLPIAGLRHLIAMKERARRGQDLADADALRRLLEASGG
jgi:predicted nucleotidyltransferase